MEVTVPIKGGTLPKSAVEEIKRKNRENLLKKYDWGFVEPYLDFEFNSPEKRVNKYITIREFKENIFKGMSIKDIYSSGVSKNLVYFMSRFCQKKVLISKCDFEECYNSGMSLEEIAKKFNISADDVKYMRQMYGIKVKGATFIKRKKTEISLTKRQKDIIYGSLLGDAKKTSPSSVGFDHGPRQKEYIDWKYKEMKGIRSENSFKKYIYFDSRYNKNYTKYNFYTLANSDIECIISEFYIDGGDKQVSSNVLEKLTPLSMAVWYMDDGSTDHRKRFSRNYTPVYSFCTDSFSHKSCENIIRYFNDKLGISSFMRERKIRKDGGTAYRIIIDSRHSNDFVNIIKPYMLKMFYYKIGI